MEKNRKKKFIHNGGTEFYFFSTLENMVGVASYYFCLDNDLINCFPLNCSPKSFALNYSQKNVM